MRRRIARSLIVSFMTLVPGAAVAGPPLLCFPIVTGDAPSLPWGTGGWNSPLTTYAVERLAPDTTALLGPDVTVLARMETLRRAVLYAARDAAAADRLLAALRERVRGPAPSKGDALARFDLGYAVEAFRQTRHAFSGRPLVTPADDGYALIRQALSARGPDPAMEYAAALVTVDDTQRTASSEHLRHAIASATPGSPLARTIAAHQPLWGTRVAALSRSGGR